MNAVPEMYDICPATNEIRMFSEYISKCCNEIYDYALLLTEKKFSKMNYRILKILIYNLLTCVIHIFA